MHSVKIPEIHTGFSIRNTDRWEVTIMSDSGKTKDTKKIDTQFSTYIQLGGKSDIDITGITERAYKAYKSVHKRKKVMKFCVYINLHDHVAYYTVNDKGADDFKINL